jgi:hypothetical protein
MSGQNRLREVRVRNWNELNQALFEETWNATIQRFRSNFAYRGDPDAAWDLRTGLMRLGGDYADLEGHMLRNFKKYAQSDAVREDSVWNWLAVAQHHGLPTRLLDWTYSPYVALHFATRDLKRYGCDGVIWCVDYVGLHKLLPKKLREVLARERSNSFTVEMLQKGAPSLGALERLSSRPFALFLEPPSLDARIVNQFALFSMMSTAGALFDEYLRERAPHLVRRIIIPAALKWEIRDKLDQANITERVLFPGLDGLSSWLKRHYMPKSAASRNEPLQFSARKRKQP